MSSNTTTMSEMSTCRSEKREMPCEIGSSGTTLGNSSDSRVQPNSELSVASCTHTESMLSLGIMRKSATTSRLPFLTTKESVKSSLANSSGCCRRSSRLSAFTSKL